MEKITYTNENGESVVLSHRPPFLLSKIDGLGDVGAEVQMSRAPYQDGSTHIDTLLEPRYINMQISILSGNRVDVSAMRERLARVFNPKIPGTIVYENGRIRREIRANSEHVPKYPSDNRGLRYQIALINLLCPNPYWLSIEKAEQLVTFSGGLTFPLRLPTIFGNQDSSAKSRIILNDGDAPTPIEVTFEGPATSPIRIENETTGEFIEVNQSLLAGEKLWISTAFGRKRVEKITVDGARVNAFHYIYIDPTGVNASSTFFQLQPGNNLLTYDTGEEYEKAPVTIRFQPCYLAV